MPPLMPRGMPSSPFFPWRHVAGVGGPQPHERRLHAPLPGAHSPGPQYPRARLPASPRLQRVPSPPYLPWCHIGLPSSPYLPCCVSSTTTCVRCSRPPGLRPLLPTPRPPSAAPDPRPVSPHPCAIHVQPPAWQLRSPLGWIVSGPCAGWRQSRGVHELVLSFRVPLRAQLDAHTPARLARGERARDRLRTIRQPHTRARDTPAVGPDRVRRRPAQPTHARRTELTRNRDDEGANWLRMLAATLGGGCGGFGLRR